MATWRPEWLAFVPTFRSLSTQRDLSRRKGKEIWPGDCLSLDSTSTRRTTHSFPRTRLTGGELLEKGKVSQSVSSIVFPFLHCLVISFRSFSCEIIIFMIKVDDICSSPRLVGCFKSPPLVSPLLFKVLLPLYLSALLLSQSNYPSRFMSIHVIPKTFYYALKRPKKEGKVTLVELLTGHTLFCVLLNYSRR